MANNEPLIQCILHIGKPIEEDVKCFDKNSWLKVKSCDQRRRSLFTSSKYFDISLPEVYSDESGYHMSCYRSFTAVKLQGSAPSDDEKGMTHLLRSKCEKIVETSSSGMFGEKCIFCLEVEIRRKGKREKLGACLNEETGENVRQAAKNLNDEEMLVRLVGVNLKTKAAKYHHSCKRDYYNKARKSPQSESTESHIEAFSKLKLHIQENFIKKEGAEYLTSLHKIYCGDTIQSNYAAREVMQKIAKEYPEQLHLCKLSNKEGFICHTTSLSCQAAVKYLRKDENSVKEAAIVIRSEILNMISAKGKTKFPLSVEDLKKDEIQPPEILSTFFRTLFTGTEKVSDNERNERLVKSIVDDVVYVTSRGHLKPSKHMSLGLGIKSLTGSRKVVELLNHFGHCINYHKVEEIETDLASNILHSNCSSPEGIEQVPGRSLGLAWDNYDEITETLSGANTLHDTVGICYQNISTEACTGTEILQVNLHEKPPDKPGSKRSLIVKEKQIQPYRKKPKITTFEYLEKEVPRPSNIHSVLLKDLIWMICTSLGRTPMWAGWNSLHTKDDLPPQRVVYMDNISLPPTRLDVIVETLRISQEVALESNEEYAIVHYDLAVAKPAMQIQQAESPRFDNVFICFGAFHIEMALFGALGFFLDGSGGPTVLIDADVLGVGSLNGFLLGKHYNRCKRLHTMLATVMKILHFEHFMNQGCTLSEDLKNKLQIAQSSPTSILLNSIETDEEFELLVETYNEFTEKTANGEHGGTAQYWIVYTKLVDLFLHFNRASRINDVDLFTFSLSNLCPIFFACHRPNYARWMVKYLHNMINMDSSHPGVRSALEGGALSIRRSEKGFSRNAVDITLEQTINADAASRSTGITAFTNSESARKRWMITRSARSSVLGHLLTIAGMKSNNDTAKTLRSHRITRDNEDTRKIQEGINNTMNPFTMDADEGLFCLTTGARVKDSVRDDLVACQSKGKVWCDEFVQGCFQDSSRFEKPIRRRKISNFASSAVKSNVKAKDLKVIELKGTRDLFGRLLFLSTQKGIDLEFVFRFPLTPVPLSLCHLDGNINKTDKAKLLHKLEERTDSEDPQNVGCVIIDAMFFLHSQVNPPGTYGELALDILEKLVKIAPRVDFVCDVYTSPSLKESERIRRGSTQAVFSITGPDQTRPRDWQKSLKSPSFNSSLFKFLSVEWRKDKYASILGDRRIFLAFEQMCLEFTRVDSKVAVESIDELGAVHEEADTRIIFHIQQISKSTDRDVVVRSNDTDVLILILHHLKNIEQHTGVWMDLGFSSNNSRRFLDVRKVGDSLNLGVLDALPGFHAFTGCDVTAAFINKGKARPFDIMEKSTDFTSVFGRLGEDLSVSEDVVLGLEKFVCVLYGKPKTDTVNEVRLQLFVQNYAPQGKSSPLRKIKGINPALMPPCRSSLIEKIKRANFVAHSWKRANLSKPEEHPPGGSGWCKTNDMYEIVWYSCDQLPSCVTNVLENDNTTSESDDETFENDEEPQSSESEDEF